MKKKDGTDKKGKIYFYHIYLIFYFKMMVIYKMIHISYDIITIE